MNMMKERKYMKNRLMQTSEAAEYTRTPDGYLVNQAKQGNVAYYLTSPRKILFARDDLDAWVASWRKMEVAHAE